MMYVHTHSWGTLTMPIVMFRAIPKATNDPRRVKRPENERGPDKRLGDERHPSE